MTTSQSSASSPAAIDAIMSKLLSRNAAEVPLTPKSPWNASLGNQIQSIKLSKGKGDVVKAALYLCNDDIEHAHDLAQAHEESMTANLCHAILHRREQDYWNSKWWLSRIKHPLLSSIHNGVSGAKQFVDDVERIEQGKGASSGSDSGSGVESRKRELQERQWEELKALLEFALKESGASS